ncbi:MAG: hypothetical protein ACK4TA_07255 [Saprospiraceae bacterium]
MRLTMFSRLLIVVAVVAAAFFAFRYFAGQSGTTAPKDNTEVTDNQTDTPADAEEETAPQADNKTTTADPGFNFVPPAPVNGQLKGVVELGASGFNSFIVRIDEEKRWSLEKSEFGSSLVHENMATPTDIREGLKQYIANMLNFGVAGKNIHFVTSSGAAKSEVTQKISAGLKQLGYVVNPVTATREGELAFRATMPEAYENDAFVVDIGSSNTKVSWMEGGQIKSFETYGSKYFQKGVDDTKVYNEVKVLAERIPADRRLVCFIIGGTPFDLAKTHRNGKERYTVLKAPTNYDVTEQKTKSGVNIYKAIQDATGTDTFVFDWDSNFTIGFLLTLPK